MSRPWRRSPAWLTRSTWTSASRLNATACGCVIRPALSASPSAAAPDAGDCMRFYRPIHLCLPQAGCLRKCRPGPEDRVVSSAMCPCPAPGRPVGTVCEAAEQSGADNGSGVPRQQERYAGTSSNGPGGSGSGMRDRSRRGTLDDGQGSLPRGGHSELHTRGQPDYLM
jgi:hypothetical protein